MRASSFSSLRRKGLVVLFLSVAITATPKISQAFLRDRCRVALLDALRGLGITRQTDWGKVEDLVKKGTPRLTAYRLVRDYPDFANRILKEHDLKWETVYRGIKTSIDKFDPRLFRTFTKGENDFGTKNGMWVSRDKSMGVLFSRGGVNTQDYAGAGIVVEMKVPSFLLEGRYAGERDAQIQRKNVPELDLYFTNYAETRPDNVGFPPEGGKLTIFNPEWKRYEAHYIAQELHKNGYSINDANRLAQDLRSAYAILFPSKKGPSASGVEKK